MTWAFRSVGTLATAFNGTMTPGAPAGFQAGDLLVIDSWSVPGNPGVPTISGFTQLSKNTSFTDAVIFGKIATGGDTMPTFQHGTDFQGCYCRAYSGAPSSITGITSQTGVERGITATSSVSFAAFATPPDNNILVLGVGVRASGSATGISFGSSGVYTTRATQAANSRPHAILMDLIQTTATSGSIVTITTSPADSASLAARGQLVFLKASLLDPPGMQLL